MSQRTGYQDDHNFMLKGTHSLADPVLPLDEGWFPEFIRALKAGKIAEAERIQEEAAMIAAGYSLIEGEWEKVNVH